MASITVPPAADGSHQVFSARKAHSRGHIGCIRRAGYEPGPAIESGVVYPACLLIGRIVGTYNRATKCRIKIPEGGISNITYVPRYVAVIFFAVACGEMTSCCNGAGRDRGLYKISPSDSPHFDPSLQ